MNTEKIIGNLQAAQALITDALKQIGEEPEPDQILPEVETGFDKERFFACYRIKFGGLKPAQVAPLEYILDRLVAEPPEYLIHTANMLGTIKWETADTYEPVREAYWLSEAWRKKNLNYYPWYGRGYIQITWEENYEKAGATLGKDLTTDPDVVMEPALAYDIMFRGMSEGWFTGKKLSDYLNDQKRDLINVRRVVNGVPKGKTLPDRAEEIRDYTLKFEECLIAAGYKV